MSRNVFRLFQNAEQLLRNAPHLARQLHSTPSLDAVQFARAKVPTIVATKTIASHQPIGKKSTDIFLPTNVLQKKSAQFIQLLQQEAKTNPEASALLQMIEDYKAGKLQVVAIEHDVPPVKTTNVRFIASSKIGKIGDEKVSSKLVNKMIIQEAPGLDLLQIVLFTCGRIALVREELPAIFPITVSNDQEYHVDGDAEIKDGKISNVVDSTALYAVETPIDDVVKTVFISNEDIFKNLDAETIAILQKNIFYTKRISLVEGHETELNPEIALYPAIYFDAGEPRFIDSGDDIMISSKVVGEELEQARDALKKFEEAIKKAEKEDSLSIAIKGSGDTREFVVFSDETTLHRRSNKDGLIPGVRYIDAVVAERLSGVFVDNSLS